MILTVNGVHLTKGCSGKKLAGLKPEVLISFGRKEDILRSVRETVTI